MAITNKIGSPVIGDDFYGREQELAKAHRYLNERQSLLLSAPRRIGKTSFARKLKHDKTEEGWKCIYIDLQGISTREAFLRKLNDSFTGTGFKEKAGKKAQDIIDSALEMISSANLGELKVDLKNRVIAENLFNRLSDKFDHNSDVLIIIDELPLFLGKLMDENEQNRDDVEFFLNWFRSIRQHENTSIRWLFCGSVGLRNFTNHYRMSQTINDLIDFKLGEFSESEAIGLIKALASSYNLTIHDDVIKETVKRLQWPIPYFIQLLIDRLISKLSGVTTTPIQLGDIESALVELSQSDYFMTWSERLDEYRDLKNMARTTLNNLALTDSELTFDNILNIVMSAKEPETVENVKEDLRKVLDMLEHDGYIMRNGKYRKFRSPLLRMWWRYKFTE